MQKGISARERWNNFHNAPSKSDDILNMESVYRFDRAYLDDKRVLDIGIGKMEYPEIAGPTSLHCGIDLSDAALKVARSANTGKTELFQADGRTSPFRAGAFDTVMSIDLITQSGVSAIKILKEICRIASETVVFQVSHSDFAEGQGRTTEPLEYGKLLRTPNPFAVFDEGDITRFLRDQGFSTENIEILYPYFITNIKDSSLPKDRIADGFVASEESISCFSSTFDFKVLEWPLLKKIFVEARKEE